MTHITTKGGQRHGDRDHDPSDDHSSAGDERVFGVAAWRETPYFAPAERAALALTEAATRLSDRADPVLDEICDEAAPHYDERALASLVIHIGLINLVNRLNVTTRQLAGQSW